MTRPRSWLAPAMALLLAAAFAASAQAQPAGGGRRGPGGMSRGSVLSLLRAEQVHKELKLNEDQIAKVKKCVDDLTAEMTKQYAALRDIEDRDQRRVKTNELSDQIDAAACEHLRDVLTKEQMMRLDQVRMQVRGALDCLADKDIADKLRLNEEQTGKVAQIKKDSDAKRSELFNSLRDANQEQRTAAMDKLRQMRTDADGKALEVLTDGQKKAFEEMKGAKFELETSRDRPPTT